MLIGRSRRCDRTIRSPLVSRRHCRLERRGQGFFLRDLGSQNGTWLEGERVDHAFLQVGDRFVAGDVILRIGSDGDVSEEGTANPRRVVSRPGLRDQLPALLILLIPVVGAVVLAALVAEGTGRDDPIVASAAEEVSAPGDDEHDAGSDPRTPPAGATVTAPRETTATVPANSSDPTTPPVSPTDPAAPPSLEELLAIAAECDRALAVREEEMAAILGDNARGASAPPHVTPRPLEEAWAGIAGAGRPIAARVEPAVGETSASADPRSRATPTRESKPAGARSDDTTTFVGPILPPGFDERGTAVGESGALFDESARADLVHALVEEGKGFIDRYHVRAVSRTPLLPVVVRLRDLGGTPAVDGLLALRIHTEDHLARVHRRVQQLERQARRAKGDLDESGSGGGEAREDELTLRLAGMVAEHLATLVEIRDDLEGAILDEGNPRFLVRAVEFATAARDVRFFRTVEPVLLAHDCRSAIPALIEAIDGREPKIRARARETLEKLTGERPGNSARAWREWWQAREGEEGVR